MKSQKIANAMNYIDDNIIIDANKEVKRAKPVWVKFMSIAAAFVLVLTGVIIGANVNTSGRVTSIVAFDVNPSIEVEINKDEEVVNVNALNADGEKVIGNMKLKKLDIETAVNAIIGSMLKNGYLSTDRNSILVSVNSADKDEAAKLQKIISDDIQKILGGKDINASVISQSYNTDKEIEKMAEENNISIAKATLVSKIVNAGLKDAKGNPYSYKTLAPLSVNELKVLLESKSVEINGVGSVGNASSSSYISRDQALESALTHAGEKADSIRNLEVEMDFDDGFMVYSIEFDTDKYEYEYEINAKSGAVVEFEKEALEGGTSSGNNGNTGETTTVVNPNPGVPTTSITRDEALSAALAHAGLTKSDVTNIEVELDDGKHYDVEFETAQFEYEYEISLDGKVIKSEKEKNDDKASTKTQTSTTQTTQTTSTTPTTNITRDEALAAALAHAGFAQADVAMIKVELDDGKHYDVEFETKEFEYDYEITLDGKVIKSEKERNDDYVAPSPTTPTVPTTPTAPTASITRDEALAVALAHAGFAQADVAMIKVELDDGKHYDVEFETKEFEYDYEITLDGKVIKSEKERNDDYVAPSPTTPTVPTTPTAPTVPTASITRDEALAVALAHAGLTKSDVKNIEVELDKDDGVTLYSVEFETAQYEYDYEVTLSGKIVESEKDHND